MARKPRIKIPNQIYSIVTRVNNSSFIFSDRDVCRSFLHHFKQIKQKLQFKCYGFVIMATHIHLIIQSNDTVADISSIMKHINGGFAQNFNFRFKRKGHFWMARFKSKIIQNTRHAINSLIYFALNPVRAGVVDNPLHYEFSSIHNIVNNQLFSDILDPLPDDLVHILINFLSSHNFLAVAKKLLKSLKAYSFNLSRKKSDQPYKHFIGSHNYIMALYGEYG